MVYYKLKSSFVNLYQIINDTEEYKYLYVETCNTGEIIYKFYTKNYLEDLKEKNFYRDNDGNLNIGEITYKLSDKKKARITDRFGYVGFLEPFNGVTITEYTSLNNNYDIVTTFKVSFSNFFDWKNY